ncbi:phospholipase A2 group XV [Trichonephila clavipes]|nr:phospholipase A2 group XV [Trichonephila clavipes]
MIYGNYYDDIVNDLISMGYKRQVDLRGAPYDFRKAPNEMEEYYSNVTNLVEETYHKNNETKVTLICHSMGCPVMTYFLNTHPQEWKDKFIKGLITLNGPFGGAIKAMKTIVSVLSPSLAIIRLNQRHHMEAPTTFVNDSEKQEISTILYFHSTFDFGFSY